jgi:hypothetical protein
MDSPATGPLATLRTDPATLAHTASRLLDSTQWLALQTHRLVLDLSVSEYAYGNLVTRLARAHESAVEDAQGTLDRVRAALEGDADQLYQTAFAFAEADERADRRAANRALARNRGTQ